MSITQGQICVQGQLPLDFVLAGTWVSGHSGEATPTVEVGVQMKASRSAVKTMNEFHGQTSLDMSGVQLPSLYNGEGGFATV